MTTVCAVMEQQTEQIKQLGLAGRAIGIAIMQVSHQMKSSQAKLQHA
jgi:phosphoserine aminotransferase